MTTQETLLQEDFSEEESARLFADDENALLRSRVLSLEIEKCAVNAGVRPERAHVLERLADVSGIDVTAEDAGEKIAQAVQAVLEEIPELLQSPAAGALGAHPRQPQRRYDPFAKGLQGE